MNLPTLKFDQKIIVKAELIEWEDRLKVSYVICDKLTGERLTKGYTVQFAVEIENGQVCYESPPILKQKLDKYYEHQNV